MNNTNENGRSMVEMLGVLAIIGILSVTGITGYTIAMNKHRANELLNEASKRAAVLAMQITAGKTNLSINEFENNNTGYGTFTTPSYAAGADTFTLTLTGVEADVCTQMKVAVGDGAGMMKITGTCGENLTLCFNKDLSRGVASCTQSETSPAATCAQDCGVCETCENGSCVAKASGTNCATGVGSGTCNGSGQCILSSCSVSGVSGTVVLGSYCLTSITYTWQGARDICGGVEHMVSLSDLPCNSTTCNFDSNFPNAGFWTSNCTDSNGACTNSTTTATSMIYVMRYPGGGSVADAGSDNTAYGSGEQALCK